MLRISGSVLILSLMWFSIARSEEVRFGRDVLPILSEHCFACHGPDASTRKGELRLDVRDAALKVIVPGEPGRSELLSRIHASDSEEVMPPASHKKPLSDSQKLVLRRWIEAGAPWGQHWAFEKPVRPAVPTLKSGRMSRHPIDQFISARLEQEQRTLAKSAAFHTLMRRVSLDLTGLPPSFEELDSVRKEIGRAIQGDGHAAQDQDLTVNADFERTYERWVDRLLASPHVGERLAMWWLDAARYSDTDGYQGDATRTNWPWRDWVIDAFNRNLSFDQFTIEQFAGDLLPNATDEQRLATCFHRNHMTNGEGGRDPEESRIDYVIDRVSTTGTLWLGLTLGCCQCHSHKFDPISQHEFYSLSAFFNSIDEDGKAGSAAKPYLAYKSPYAERAVIEARQLVEQRTPKEAAAKQTAETKFVDWLAARSAEARNGFVAWQPLLFDELESLEGTQLTQLSDHIVQASGPNPRHDDYRVTASVKLPRVTGLKLDVLPHESHTRGGLSRGTSGEFILTDIKVQVRRRGSSQIRDVLVAGAVADVSADQKDARSYGDIKGVLDDDPRNGWTTLGHDVTQPHLAVFQLAEPLSLEPDELLVFELRQRSTIGDANIGRFRVSVTDQAGATVRSVGLPPLEELANIVRQGHPIDQKLRDALRDQFLADHEPYQIEKLALDRAARQLKEIEAAAKKVDVMVLAERKEPRPTHVLVRGVWDKKGDLVERGVPAAIAAWPMKTETDSPRTREQLARWIVSRDNPLTARVIVNHVWQMLFGAGLVRTPEDFGLQGEQPTHPELLDWLAVDFMEHGWDMKRLLKQIVMSETYRQDSSITPELLLLDPDNRLLARGARFRLPSWMLRDAALKAAGLLNPALGGPPVKPFQPDGVWEEMFMGRFKYEASEGAAQYRRTVYAFWRRAISPTFLFDSAQRRTCEVRPARTNTPLHALTMLNDANYLVAARALAEQSLLENADVTRRLTQLMRNVLCRAPKPNELAVLRRELDRAHAYYSSQPRESTRFLRDIPPIAQTDTTKSHDKSLSDTDLAAYTLIASLILNLDETLNHE